MSKRAFIVSGGFGTRLRPYTSVIPKPLLPVGAETLLERQIGSLIDAGVHDITVSLHYLPHLFEGVIEAFSRKRGLQIKLAIESTPMGTFGGVLQACRDSMNTGDERPFLVLNADIVSDIDLPAFHAFGMEGRYEMAIAANNYLCKIPYGVITSEGNNVKHIEEKPNINLSILAGVYFVRPSVTNIAFCADQAIGVDQVLKALIESETPIGVYSHLGEWVDAGTIEDLETAARILANN